MQLSKHFYLSELTKSQTAARKGWNNIPDAKGISKLRLLCEKVLEPVRAEFGVTVCSSGYRSPRVNRAVGGSKTSQHRLCEAADFEVPGVANPDVARWMERRLNYDQLILEFYKRGQPNSGWIHVSYREGRLRNMEMTALRVKRLGRWKTVYITGLVTNYVIEEAESNMNWWEEIKLFFTGQVLLPA